MNNLPKGLPKPGQIFNISGINLKCKSSGGLHNAVVYEVLDPNGEALGRISQTYSQYWLNTVSRETFPTPQAAIASLMVKVFAKINSEAFEVRVFKEFQSELFVVWEQENDTKFFRYQVSLSRQSCSCNKYGCTHLLAVKRQPNAKPEIILDGDFNQILITYKVNPVVPVNLIQHDPNKQFWFNDVSPRIFANYVDAMLNRSPVGIYAGMVGGNDLVLGKVVKDVDFSVTDRTVQFTFQDGSISQRFSEETILPILYE